MGEDSKVRPEKTELRYYTSSQLGQLLREDKGSYFGHLILITAGSRHKEPNSIHRKEV
jgi:hypothetical protein